MLLLLTQPNRPTKTNEAITERTSEELKAQLNKGKGEGETRETGQRTRRQSEQQIGWRARLTPGCRWWLSVGTKPEPSREPKRSRYLESWPSSISIIVTTIYHHHPTTPHHL